MLELCEYVKYIGVEPLVCALLSPFQGALFGGRRGPPPVDDTTRPGLFESSPRTQISPGRAWYAVRAERPLRVFSRDRVRTCEARFLHRVWLPREGAFSRPGPRLRDLDSSAYGVLLSALVTECMGLSVAGFPSVG